MISKRSIGAFRPQASGLRPHTLVAYGLIHLCAQTGILPLLCADWSTPVSDSAIAELPLYLKSRKRPFKTVKTLKSFESAF
jgi:hypothetical protein